MSTMAGMDGTRNVQVNLTANITPYQRAMRDAAAATNVLLTGVTKLGRGVDDLVKRAGKRLVLVGAGDIAALTAAAEATNRLDVALTQVRATSAVTGQSVNGVKRAVMDLGRSIPDSTNNIARLMGQIQSMGVQGTATLTQMTVVAERLAAATNTAPGELFSGLLTLTRQMGNSLPTISNYSSVLVQLSKSLGVAPQEMLGFASSIAAVAQQAGYSQNQILALSGAMTRAGADSAAAANVFTTVTTEINQAVVTGNAQLHQFGQMLGMTAQQFKAFAQSHPEQAFERIIQTIRNQGQGGILTLQQMGLDGPRSYRAITQAGLANIGQAMNIANEAFTKNTALTKSSDAAWNDLSSTMQKFRNNIDDIVVKLGGPMLHVLDMFFEGANKVLGPINGILQAMGPIPGIVAGIGGAFLMVTGTITAFSVALIAALAAWRAVSGMTGTNSVQGFFSGLRAPQGTPYGQGAQTFWRGNDVNMAGRSRPANAIFSGMYGLGQRMSAPPPLNPTFSQRMMGRFGAGLGAVARFPLRKTRAELIEAADTLGLPVLGRHGYDPKALIDYERRQSEAFSPYSIPGMFTRGQAAWQRYGLGARSAGLNMYERLPQAIQARLNVDTTAAREKIEQIRAEGSTPINTRLIPSTDLRVAAGGRQIPQGTTDLRDVAMNAPWFLEGGEAAAQGGRLSGLLSSTVRGMGTFAAAMSNVIFPLTMFATVGGAAWATMMKFSASASRVTENVDDLGAALVRASGGTYTKPTSSPSGTTTPADRVQPWSAAEVKGAESSAFQKTASDDINRLTGRRGINRVRVAQNMVQNMVANNNGQPLTSGQQMVVRQALVAAYGIQGAQAVYNQLQLGGISPQQQALNNAALFGAVPVDRSYHGFGRKFGGSMAISRIQTAITPLANDIARGDYGSAALGFSAIAQNPNLRYGGGGREDTGMLRLHAGLDNLLAQVNKGLPHSQQIDIGNQMDHVHTIADFIRALEHGTPRAQALALALEKAGLNVASFGDTVSAYTRAAASGGRKGGVPAIPLVQSLANRMGFNPTNATDADYATQMQAITYQLQSGGNNIPAMTDVAALGRARDAWEAYKATLDATSPALQGVQAQIDSLNQAIQGQNAIFMNPGQIAQGYAATANSMVSQFGTGGLAGQSEQTYIGMAQSQITAAEGQLKSYMEQVHQFHIQEREAFYERNVQIRQMNHEFSEQIRQMNFQMANSYGNPTQFVQAQYTVGADQAMLAMNHQVHMLQASKDAMDTLHRQGLSRDAIRLLGLDDPTNVEQAQRYVQEFAQNPKLVQAFNASIKNRLKISEGIDTDTNNSKFADMKRQFNYNAQQAAQAFEHAQQQAAQQINELGQQLYTNFAELSKAALSSGLTNIQNYAAGIIAAIGQVQTATQNYLNSTPGGGGGAQAPGGRKWTGTPTGNFTAPMGLHRAGKDAGVNAGFLLTTISKPGTGMDRMGNPDLHWGKDVAVAPDNRLLVGNAKIAQAMAKTYGWGDGPEWAALYQIWQQESGFSTSAGSPDKAYGIPQADPGTKMASHGRDWKTNPRTQISWGLDYIAKDYGDPLGAWAHKSRTGWYHTGGVFGSPQVIGVGDGGPEAVIPLNNVGASFVANVVSKTIAQTGVNRSSVMMTHTLPRATVQIGNIAHHYNQSTNFTGDITVQSQDPNEMARKLQARKRLAALSRPIARTS